LGAAITAPDPHGQAQAHPADVDQIIDNLIDNALTYAPGAIEINTGEANGRAFLAIRDHGPGIPGPELAHVTERFYRGRASPRGGTGLGLAIARDLAEKWGGTLSVECPADGGTRVEVELRKSALANAEYAEVNPPLVVRRLP
jgi:signal transduction histidine kinase